MLLGGHPSLVCYRLFHLTVRLTLDSKKKFKKIFSFVSLILLVVIISTRYVSERGKPSTLSSFEEDSNHQDCTTTSARRVSLDLTVVCRGYTATEDCSSLRQEVRRWIEMKGQLCILRVCVHRRSSSGSDGEDRKRCPARFADECRQFPTSSSADGNGKPHDTPQGKRSLTPISNS